EDDLPIAELRARLAELRAVCLGTNVGAGLSLPPSATINVGGGIKVGLVGVVMTDPAAYRGRPFGGVELLPANDAAIEEALRLEKSGCAMVVPITHQTIAEDRALARRKRDPA